MGAYMTYLYHYFRPDPQKITVSGDGTNLREPGIIENLIHQNPCWYSMIELDNGLLDKLRIAEVLTQEQFERIEHSSGACVQAGLLMTELARTGDDNIRKFLSILNSKQPHVANYFSKNGQRPSSDENNWPIFGQSQWTRIQQNWTTLIELVDSRNGLLDELLAVEFIEQRQLQRLDSEHVDAYRNKQLLTILLRKSFEGYHQFVDCLLKTEQREVVTILEPDRVVDTFPLTEKQKSRIVENYPTLIQYLVADSRFLLELHASGCITKRQQNLIESAKTPSEANKQLLGILLRGSQQKFEKFICHLGNTPQNYLCPLLNEDSVVVCVTAKQIPAEDVKRIEQEIVERFMLLPYEHRHELFYKLKDGTCQLLMGMQTHSIGLFYMCRSLSGLLKLRELYDDGQQLKKSVQELFNSLLDVGQVLTVDFLEWNLTEYHQRVQYLSSAVGLPLYSHVYQLAEQKGAVELPFACCSIQLTVLPHELLEMIILKSALLLYAVLKTCTTRAELYTLVTLCAVSQYWCETLTYRKRNVIRLRQSFTRVCRPYRRNPRLVARLPLQGYEVMGVAELNNKLYVIFGDSFNVRVIATHSTYDQLTDIKLPVKARPTDIATCDLTECLYFADMSQVCVWKIDTVLENIVQIKTDCRPWTLSTKNRFLLVTPYEGGALFIYDDGDQLVNTIKLPSAMKAHHSVETQHGTYIVSHTPLLLFNSTSPTSLSELLPDGEIIRSYGCQHLTGGLGYIILDINRQLLVADSDNKRILHLDSNLNLTQVLLAELEDCPAQMFYSGNVGNLYICSNQSENISIFNVKK